MADPVIIRVKTRKQALEALRENPDGYVDIRGQGFSIYVGKTFRLPKAAAHG